MQAVLWVPVIRATGDVAKMAGYPVGRWWRMKQRALIVTLDAKRGGQPKETGAHEIVDRRS
jgi:hypothetical protein